MKHVQLGLKGRHSPNNVHVRAELIQKAAFSEQTVTTLDLGIRLVLFTLSFLMFAAYTRNYYI